MEHEVTYFHCFLGEFTLTLEDVARLTLLPLLGDTEVSHCCDDCLKVNKKVHPSDVVEVLL